MGKIFLLNTITSWEEPPRARHQLAFALALNHNVIFVTRNKTGLPKIRVYHPQKNITVIEPVFPVNYKFRYRIPIINEIYQLWLFKWISKNISFDHFLNFDFTARYIFNYFKDIVYYCNDDYIGNSKYPIWVINKYHQMCENFVIKRAIFCIATSHFLYDKLKSFNHNTFLIPLGGPDLKDNKITPERVFRSETVIVNLIYFNTNHLDYKLINDLLGKKNVRVVCIGPRDKEFESKIHKKDNISFKGVLKGIDLYQEINKADIGIAPYDIQKVNKGGTPNKLWHYFAVGKPVVISNLPNLAFIKFPDKFVYVYNSSADFYNMIQKAYAENNDSLIEQRVKFAAANSWDKRTEELLSIANNYFTK
jgi:hypothetical protein